MRYQYVLNSPTNYKDYYGYAAVTGTLAGVSIIKAVVAAIVGAGSVVGGLVAVGGVVICGAVIIGTGYAIYSMYPKNNTYDYDLRARYGDQADEYDKYYRNPGISTWTEESGQNSGARPIDGGIYYAEPKKSPNFKTPTNPAQDPPEIPEGWVEGTPNNGRGKIYTNPNNPGETIRVVPEPTPGYPDGYWVRTNPNKQPIDPSTGKPGSRPETHVPLPSN